MRYRWFCNYFYLIIFLFSSQSGWTQNNKDKASFISSVDDAKIVRLQLLNEAKKEILISYFIYKDDPMGLIGLEYMVMAKEANPDIKIKLLLDASANGISKHHIQYIESKGIEVKEFHPIPHLFVSLEEINPFAFFRKLSRVNNRMHDKLILVDGEKMVVGGRNISRKYYGLSDKNFHDLDGYIVSSKLGESVREYFYKIWDSEHSSPIRLHFNHRKGRKHRKTISEMKGIRNYINNHPEHLKLINTSTHPFEKSIDVDSVSFLNCFDEEQKSLRPIHLTKKLLKYMSKTQKSIVFETPYLLPTRRFYRFLDTLLMRNVDVSIVTNSICSTDIMAVAAAYDNHKKKLLKMGVRIYEYKGPDYLHVKAAVIDEATCLIGSYNLDPRSAYLNTENVYIISGKKIARELTEIIRIDKENAQELHLKDDMIIGEYIDCDKPFIDEVVYSLFSVLSKFRIVYGLL